MNDFIFCALKDYAAENLSCIIKTISEQQQGKCNNTLLDNSTYAHDNVSIAHLPRNQILCFVAEVNYNSTSTVILVGNFSTPIGIIFDYIHVFTWLLTIATGVIFDDIETTVYQTTIIIAVVVIITVVATIAASMVIVYIVILKRKQRRNSGDSVMWVGVSQQDYSVLTGWFSGWNTPLLYLILDQCLAKFGYNL